MENRFKHIIDLFRSTSDEDIIKACENADKKSKKKGENKKNEQTSS